MTISTNLDVEFIAYNFQSWQQILGFADAEILSRKDLEAQYLQNLLDLSMGCRFIINANHPYPVSSGASQLITSLEPLTLPINAAQYLKNIAAAFLELDKGKDPLPAGQDHLDRLFENLIELKKLVPTTTSEAVASIWPYDKKPMRPEMRAETIRLIDLALSEGVAQHRFPSGEGFRPH